MSAAAKKKKKKTMKTRDFILACLLVRIGWIYIYIHTHSKSTFYNTGKIELRIVFDDFC